jgi:hypothetical protein
LHFSQSFCSDDATQLNEGFGSGFCSAGVSPVILWTFTPRESTGETPALPKTSPAALKSVIPIPPIRIVVRNVGLGRCRTIRLTHPFGADK